MRQAWIRMRVLLTSKFPFRSLTGETGWKSTVPITAMHFFLGGGGGGGGGLVVGLQRGWSFTLGTTLRQLATPAGPRARHAIA
jgi:hypothetical protein